MTRGGPGTGQRCDGQKGVKVVASWTSAGEIVEVRSTSGDATR